MSEAPTTEAQFKNKTDEGTFISGTEWESYEEVITADDTHYKVGDLILIESDPVGGNGCERVMQALFATRITDILKNRGKVEMKVAAPIGRIDTDGIEGFIPMDEDRVQHSFNADDKLLQRFLDDYLSGDHEDYLNVVFHYNAEYPDDNVEPCEYCEGKNDGIERNAE